jgi:hypothetical protein
MLAIKTAVPECTASSITDLPTLLAQQTTPLVIRDLVADWPLVTHAQHSAAQAIDYLTTLASNAPVRSFSAPAKEQGYYFYNSEMTGFNFSQHASELPAILATLKSELGKPESDSVYMGSTNADYCAPQFSAEHPLAVTQQSCLKSLWVGNHSRIAAHYDNADNLACVAAGEREFILFPPEQVTNLYIGPLEFTPAGQPVSLVDFTNPDFTKFSRFKHALEHAQIAKLNPGDAIFIPTLWWHHVTAQAQFNVLVNYWWRNSPNYLANPFDALLHSMLAIKDLPQPQRDHWQQLFAHYVFSENNALTAQIAPNAAGILAKIDEQTARKVRALLLQKLNR